MDQKDKELEDLFRPLGEKSKLPSTALTTEFKKKKRRAWTEDLPEMKFEKPSPPVKKRTPEEIEASRLMWARPEQQVQGPSLLEKLKRLGKAAIDVNVGRATGDTKRMMSGYKYLNE
jgi:hypothetical protein